MKDNIHSSPFQREQIWSLLDPGDNAERAAEIARLRDALGITEVTARLLCNRGYTTPQEAELFLGKDERAWHDPMDMKDMPAAVERVLAAVGGGETIAIYGDYDVDGVTSVTSLYLYLSELGARVEMYIPSRTKEGYGMSKAGIDTLAEHGVQLIITVDTGITADQEILYASSRGMDTVVTDHHECHTCLPGGVAVVNPHRPDCPYPFKDLAGVGVVFKLICACEAVRLGCEPGEAFRLMSERFIDLVAIGTIADVMPLCDENRFIVSRGLAMLDHTQRPGLVALLDAISGGANARPSTAGASPKKARRKINSGLIGYGIAPRINAAGRISHAMRAVNLLLATSAAEAETLAAELCEINTRRQSEENRIAEQAYRMIEERLASSSSSSAPEQGGMPSWNQQVLVLEDDCWMQGIVGIVASRITEKYGLPSILISFDGATHGQPEADDIGKGSGRSVKGLNLVEALSYCQDTLVRFGGHELAAGLTIRRGDIPAFCQRMNQYAASHLTDDMTAVRYEAECLVTMADLTMEQALEMDRLEPYGVGNQTPVFMMQDVLIHRITSLGAGRHTKLTLYADGQMMQAVWFGMPAAQLPCTVGDSVDVLFNLNINDYQGMRTLQMILQNLRLHQRPKFADQLMSEECSSQTYRKEAERLREVLQGAPFARDEQLLPNREDIARVYTCLRHRVRQNVHAIHVNTLTEEIGGENRHRPGYIKLRLMLQILNEMKVCRIREQEDGLLLFDIPEDVSRTCVEASPLYCRLQEQCQKE